MPLTLIDCTAHPDTPCHVVFDTDALATHARIEQRSDDMWQVRFLHNGVPSRWPEPERFYAPEAAFLQLDRWHLAEVAA